MTGRRRQRGRVADGPVPLSRLHPPPGAPDALRRLAARARYREVLGDELGRRLVDVAETDDEVRLVFSDVAWAAAARSQVRRIAARASGLLSGRRLAFATPQGIDDATPGKRGGSE